MAAPVNESDGDERVGALRGASVGADGRRIAHFLVAASFLSVLGLAIALFVAGVNRNREIDDLRGHGVSVAVTVTSCRGLLGGSGSNPVGYTCQGAFVLSGQSYSVTLPDTALHATGSTVPLIAARDDPGLLATEASVASDRSSLHVFILPSLLVLVDAGALVLVAVRRRDDRVPNSSRKTQRERPGRDRGGV